jgi:uncharacterized SAM-binding protein YcdF (DUF218 family)
LDKARLEQLLRTDAIGPDGVGTLVLSFFIILVTLGLTWQFLTLRCLMTAFRSSSSVANQAYAAVLGMQLQEDQVVAEYRQRLDKGYEFLHTNPTGRLWILGGTTGNSGVSEAEAGKEYLLKRGEFDARIALEDQSRHTLENLRGARNLMPDRCKFILITSRYHLARSQVLAEGLDMHPVICGVESRFELTRGNIGKLMKEGLLLHWYYTGRIWAKVFRNKKMLQRIT